MEHNNELNQQLAMCMKKQFPDANVDELVEYLEGLEIQQIISSAVYKCMKDNHLTTDDVRISSETRSKSWSITISYVNKLVNVSN